jgi:twitching motility protein PilT
MPRIDRLLGAMMQQGADALRLVAGKPARLERGTALQALTAEPLTEAQVSALLQEIVPPDLAPQLGKEARLSFVYQSPVGLIEVTLAPEDGVGGATFRSAPKPSAATTVGEPEAPDLSEARAQMDRLLRRLVELGGSDLHLRAGVAPLVRQDGELVRLEEPPISAERLETLLRSIMPPRGFASYRGDNDHDWAYEISGIARYRCNAGRDRTGPTGVFRQIPAGIRSADELGLSREVQQLCGLTKGLVLVTGPTGSGKSTTLAAMTDLVNSTRADHIITIEDPIEFVHQSKRCLITQREIGTHTKSFKAALRAALREDPDVVLVGELRDLETMSIAIETAETGHLVFGTLHTTTAPSTLDRIIDQFPADRQPQIRVMLSESLRGVVAQVLCRKIGGGRVAAREILLSIPAVANLIREGKTFQIPSIMQTNRKLGMVTLNEALMELVQAGSIEPREAYIKSADKAGLLGSLKAKGVNTTFLGEV